MYEDGNVYVQLKTAQRKMPPRTYNILESLHSQAQVDVLSEISPLYYNRLRISQHACRVLRYISPLFSGLG